MSATYRDQANNGWADTGLVPIRRSEIRYLSDNDLVWPFIYQRRLFKRRGLQATASFEQLFWVAIAADCKDPAIGTRFPWARKP
jgi:hypothetical protein